MSGYRPEYTIDEEKKIINYIIKNNEFARLKGDRLWKEMASKSGLKRTWQSLKQHFRKKLIYKLHYPELGIDNNIQKKIYECYHCTPLSKTINTNNDKNNCNKDEKNTRDNDERRSVGLFRLTSSSSSSDDDN